MAKFSISFLEKQSFMVAQSLAMDIFHGVIQKGKCFRGQSPGETLSWGAIFLRSNFLEGGQFSSGQLSWENFSGFFTCFN